MVIFGDSAAVKDAGVTLATRLGDSAILRIVEFSDIAAETLDAADADDDTEPGTTIDVAVSSVDRIPEVFEDILGEFAEDTDMEPLSAGALENDKGILLGVGWKLRNSRHCNKQAG